MHATDQANTAAILADLSRREPIFHRSEFPTAMSDDYWEVGASGAIYTRAFILDHLARNPPIDAAAANWRTSNFRLTPLGSNTFLLTYDLDQNGRHTRRSTIWRHTGTGWEILYHQGTILQSPTI